MRKDKFENSTLIQKLTKKITFYYTTIYITLFVLLISILAPFLYHDAISKKAEYTSLITDQYKQALATTTNDLNQLSASPEMITLLKNYTSSPTPKNSALIRLYLQSTATNDNRIQLISVETEDGSILSSLANSSDKVLNYLQNSPSYSTVNSSSYSSCASPVLPQQLWPNNQNHFMYFAQQKIIYNNKFTFCIIYNIEEYLRNSLVIYKRDFSQFAILSNNKETIYSSSSDFVNDLLAKSFPEKLLSSKTHQIGLNGVLFSDQIVSNGWLIITYADWFKLLSNLIMIMLIIVTIYFISPILYAIFLVPSITRFLRPLSDLTKAVSTYTAEDEINVSIHTHDEIEILSNTLHSMSIKIKQQVQDIQDHERENAITQYRLLATQIDPHFIYNTLNIVNILARKKNTDGIVSVNTALSRILRERLNTKTSIFETIQNELETIDQYCVIMKYRYINSVEINLNADPALLNEKVPKNLLLPIVENAFSHGLTDDNGNVSGTIDINIYSMGDNIVIEISDDGIGISPEMLNELDQNHYQVKKTDREHVGLTNVYERLHYAYGNDFSFHVESELHFGTTFSISLPYLRSTEQSFIS